MFPRFRHSRMHALAEVLPGAVSPLAAAASIVVGILLLLLAHGLKRRKRRAWGAAVALLPVGIAAQLVYRHSVFGAVLSLALLVFLVWHRREFAALPDPRSRWKALANLVVLGGVSFGIGLVIVSSHPHKTIGSPSSGSAPSTSCGACSASRARSPTPTTSTTPSATRSAHSAC